MKRKSSLSISAILFLLVVGLTSASYAETLSGRVYEGEYLTEPPTSQGLSDVTVKLYGSYSSGVPGDELDSHTTGSDGWFGLETEEGYEYFTIVCEGKSGYTFQGSSSVGGSASGEEIEYEFPLTGKTLTGNKFWYKSETPEPPENNPPVANDDYVDMYQDNTVDIDVLDNDTDPDGDPLHINSATDPPNGTTVNHGTHITYTPDPGFSGSDTFDYTAGDGKGGTDTATVTVEVLALVGGGEPPVANDDSATTSQDTAVDINVLANDSDPDGDPLNINSATDPPHGTTVNHGTHITYTPDPGFVGTDTFDYTVGDGKDGTDTATVTITVQEGGEEPPEGTGTIRGMKYNDLNGNGQKDPGEPGLSGWQIFIDLNDNNRFDEGERQTTTDSNGNYSFTDLEADAYRIHEVNKTGWRQTDPAVEGVPGYWLVGLEEGQEVTEIDFGNQVETPTGDCTINVYKFEDKNGDCVWDTDEQGLANWKICLDNNQNCQCDPGEPFAITDATGWCSFDVACNDTYYLAEELKTGWERTCPKTPPCEVSIQTASPQAAYLVWFGNRQVAVGEEACCLPDGSCVNLTPVQCRERGGTPQGPGTACQGDNNGDGIDDICGGQPPEGEYDYGDAPAPYPDASHELGRASLGSIPPDAENGTQPNPPGLGDDVTGTNDEDGAQFLSDLVPGKPFGVSWESYMNGSALMVMAGWIDLNRDGDWDDPGELIGSMWCGGCSWAMMTVPKQMPAGVMPGKTYARFRLFEGMDKGGLALVTPSGHGGPGEVEDYEVEIKLDGTVLPPGEIVGGVKFHDLNGSSVRDAGEPGLAGWTIWIDLNGNGVKDAGEETLTNSDGTFYFMALNPGTYTVHEDMKPGWYQTYPGGAGTQTITVQAGQPTPSILFGNQQTGQPSGDMDFGDAPDSYGTLHASGGAYHDVNPNLHLGASIDAESDGQPDPHALGDDNNGDDEDGLTNISSLVPGQPATATIQIINNEAVSLDITVGGWLDFGGDGKWDLVPDHIGTHSMIVPAFSTTPFQFTFTVPTAAIPGPTFARFRLFRVELEPDVHYLPLPTGYGEEGEVEDYEVQIVSEAAPGEVIHGYKWNDLDGDSKWDIAQPVEPPLAGWTIWLDMNGNGTQDAGDLTTQTDAQGHFMFPPVSAGTYVLGEVQQAGWTQTTPTSGTYTVTVQGGQGSFPMLFGNQQTTRNDLDYGDAPYDGINYFYPSANHQVGGPWWGDLSDLPDVESGMQRNNTATGDDADAFGDDENGLFGVNLVQGQSGGLLVSFVPGGSGDVTLAGWIDFNGDGDWDDAGEASGPWPMALGPAPAGGWPNPIAIILPFIVPAHAHLGQTFARLRIEEGLLGSISHTGPAGAGEVEDHLVEIKASGPPVPSSSMIWGIKFNDLNGNSNWEAGTEPLLPNWTIWLDSNHNGVYDGGDATTQTDGWGLFMFTGLAAGTYLVGEEQQAGWVQTFPVFPVTHTVTVQLNTLPWGVLFGNQQTGPGVPGEGEVPHVKWSQPPIEIDPNLELPPVFCGWDEPARSTEPSGQIRQWRMNADDFRCLGPIPITRIRWWGGYKAWTLPEPPESQPETWHIGFWANQVEGLEPDQLYLERLVWSVEIPNERVHREPVGLTEFPQQLTEMCFTYEVQLEPEEWFYQTEFESNEGVFWISITAIYPPDAEQVNQWGWTTRPHLWGNGAVMPAIIGEWPTYDERLFPGRIYPIENSVLCGQNQAYDLCFELLTEQPWVKWDLPFTNLREWPHYEDHESYAIEDPNGDLLIGQRVSDDWLCERLSPIIAVAWNGSYTGYGYEACRCGNSAKPKSPDYFVLTLRTNAPADVDVPYEHPGPKVWEYEATEFDEVLVGFDKHLHGEPNEAVFRYMVRLPEDAWFQQEAPEQIYWLSIMAVYKGTVADTIMYPWAWTNHRYAFGSTAMGSAFTEQGTQTNFLYDQTSEHIDMSFTLYTLP